MALERARTQLDTAQKQCAEWDTIARLQANFDQAQEAMIRVGIEANHSLPRSVQGEGARVEASGVGRQPDIGLLE